MKDKSILVVDDNPTNLKLIKLTLTLEGYEVLTAMDANEAMDILSQSRPNLILMDLQLPGISGLELTSQLKSNEKYKEIIIVAVTAYAMKGDEEKAIAAGCNGYITKPIDVNLLPKTVAGYLE